MKLYRAISQTIAQFWWLGLLLVGSGAIWKFSSEPEPIGFHLRLGELILASSSLPWEDTFSWSAAGMHYAPEEWLHGVVLAATNASPLLIAVVLLFAGVGVFLLSQERGQHSIGPWVSLVTYFIFTRHLWSLSPHLWSILLLPYLALYSGREHLRARVIAIFLLLLWANFDRGVVAFPLLLCSWLIGAAVEQRSLRPKNAGTLLFIAAVVLVPVFTPAGFALYCNFLSAFSGENLYLPQLVGFERPNFHNLPLFAGAPVLLIFALAKLNRTLPWREVFTLLASLLMMVFVTRLAPPFMLCLALVVGEVAEQLFQRIKQSESRPSRVAELLLAMGLGASVFYVSNSFEARDPLWGEVKGVIGEISREYEQRGATLRLVNDLPIAGELIGVSVPVYIDKRPTLYRKALEAQTLTGNILSDYTELFQLKSRWREVLEFWKFNVAVVSDNNFLPGLLVEREGWQVVKHLRYRNHPKNIPNPGHGVIILKREH